MLISLFKEVKKIINLLTKQIKIKFFKNLKKINFKTIFNKELTEIKKIKLDKFFNIKEIKKINFMNFKFNKEKKKINFPFKIVFLNEIKIIKFKFFINKPEIESLLENYSNNLFIKNNKEYILKRFDFYFDAFQLSNNIQREKIISDLNKFLYWIDINNFYYLNQIDTIDYKNFWRF